MKESGRKRLLTGGILVIWAAGVILLGGWTMGAHTMPLREHVVVATSVPPQAQWRVQHFLTGGCPCSAQVARDLEAAAPLGPQEVYILGSDEALRNQLSAKGYQVFEIAPVAARVQMGVVGGPWLRVYRPDASLAYSGGYAGQRPTRLTPTNPQGLIAEIEAGRVFATLPAYGCAASGL